MRTLALPGMIAAAVLGCTPVDPQASEPVASDEVTGALFVANKRGNTLSKIDLASGEEVKRVDSCANPHELATSPDGSAVALACYGGTTVDIFMTEDLSRFASIELGANARPHGIVWHKSGTLYATAEGRQSIFSIEEPLVGEQLVTEYKTNQLGSHMLAVSPDESTAWTTDLGSRTVTRVDLGGEKSPLSVEVGEEPEGISLTPDGSALWISARGSNEAYELDPETMAVRKTVKTGAFPLRIAVRPQGDVSVTSDLAAGGLSVIDLAKGEVARSIAVSNAEEAEQRVQVTILWSEDGERVYAAETGTDTIAEVDFASGTVIRRLSAGNGGDGLAILTHGAGEHE